jgi:hypothetical protein
MELILALANMVTATIAVTTIITLLVISRGPVGLTLTIVITLIFGIIPGIIHSMHMTVMSHAID